MSETTTAQTMTVLAELVLLATRHNLPTPKYVTTSERSEQLCLTLNNRADLDAWHWAFGGGRLWECEPTEASPTVLVTNMHSGSLLGWSVNVQANVEPPLSPEVLAALGEAARSDAAAVLDEPAPTVDLIAAVLAIPCPSCKAEAGKACVNRPTSHSHIKRRQAADAAAVLVAEAVAVLDEPKAEDCDCHPNVPESFKRAVAETAAKRWPEKYGPLVEVVPEPTAEAPTGHAAGDHSNCCACVCPDGAL